MLGEETSAEEPSLEATDDCPLERWLDADGALLTVELSPEDGVLLTIEDAADDARDVRDEECGDDSVELPDEAPLDAALDGFDDKLTSLDDWPDWLEGLPEDSVWLEADGTLDGKSDDRCDG